MNHPEKDRTTMAKFEHVFAAECEEIDARGLRGAFGSRRAAIARWLPDSRSPKITMFSSLRRFAGRSAWGTPLLIL